MNRKILQAKRPAIAKLTDQLKEENKKKKKNEEQKFKMHAEK